MIHLKKGILFCFLLNTIHCISQNRITFIGRVIDEHHNLIRDAGIIETLSKTGTTSNRNGFFSLTVPRQAILLNIQFTGYETAKVDIPADSLKLITADTIFLHIVLNIKVENLEMITITDEKVVMAFNKSGVLILDYDFYGDFLLLLSSEGRNCRLRLIDDSRTTISELKLNIEANNFFKDCYGNPHLVDKDSTHQINFKGTFMSLMEGHSVQKFSDYVLPLAAATPGHLFPRSYGLHNQSIVYFNYDKEKNSKNILKIIRNTEAENFATDYQRQASLGRWHGRGNYFYSEPLPVIHPNLKQAQSSLYNLYLRRYNTNIAQQKEWFYSQLLTIPVYDPLFAINDSLFLFDHIDDTAFVYNTEGVLIRQFGIKYHHKAGWSNELMIDKTTNEIYGRYVRNSGTYITQINTASGNAMQEYHIEHIFPKNIQVKNGYAYYLCLEHTDDLPVTNIYKQKLK